MTLIRRAILAFALIAGIAPAIAQVPPPVPALPDTERRTSYSISGTTCACAVGFQLFGDSTDVGNWLEVFINGALIPQAGNWTITSPTGSLATIPRPITDAVLTFTVAQTGTVQIVGARRPRRTSQFNEGAGVPTRNFNVVLSDLTAQNREVWDKINDVTGRSVRAPPGETLALLPSLSGRASMNACFDGSGNLTSCVALSSGSVSAGTGIVFTGTGPTTISAAATYSAGAGITFTGTFPTVISAPAVASSITYTPPWTSAVAYPQSKYDANVVYATDFLGAQTCDGTTDVSTQLNAFLTAVSAAGATSTAVTGIFPPGVCFVSSQLTFTINTSPNTVNYRLVGNGTVIKPDITKAIGGLYLARGTFTTFEDERTTTNVEWLVIDQHNNANATFGFLIERPMVRLYHVTINAGDDNGTHNSGSYIGAWWRNPVANNTDPNFGPFWGELAWSTFKGRTAAMPTALNLTGPANSFQIHNNLFLVVGDAIVSNPMCSANTLNCSTISDGVSITQNDFESFTNAVRFFNISNLSFASVFGWEIYNNRAEAGTTFLNLGGLAVGTTAPTVLGPNMLESSVTTYFLQGATPVALDVRDVFVGEAAINPASLAGTSTATIGTAAALGATVGMLCDAAVSGDTSGIITTCFVSGANTITFRNTNATSGAIDLASQTYFGRAHYPY